VVVGETLEQIDAALEKIDFELQPLPILSDPHQAMQPDAPVLHEWLRELEPETPNVLNISWSIRAT